MGPHKIDKLNSPPGEISESRRTFPDGVVQQVRHYNCRGPLQLGAVRPYFDGSVNDPDTEGTIVIQTAENSFDVFDLGKTADPKRTIKTSKYSVVIGENPKISSESIRLTSEAILSDNTQRYNVFFITHQQFQADSRTEGFVSNDPVWQRIDPVLKALAEFKSRQIDTGSGGVMRRILGRTSRKMPV